MKLLIITVVLLLLSSRGVNGETEGVCFKDPSRRSCNPAEEEGTGERLILTPFIEQGQVDEARALAEVKNLVDDPEVQSIKSYSGYFTVNKKFNSNLFFWFFPAENNPEDNPVLLWVDGGPGVPSLTGLLTGIGPFILDQGDETLSLNPYSWTMNHSVIFIDSPVGTGFSFTESYEGYATNQTQIGDDLYSALIQFFRLFPAFRKNPFYVAGSSYSGKYVPVIGYTIYKRNPGSKLKINLQGLSIGNGWIDPESMVTGYSSFLYQLGYIDEEFHHSMGVAEKFCVDAIQTGNFKAAFELWTLILAAFRLDTGYSSSFNIYYEDNPWSKDSLEVFVQKERTRRAIHVGDTEYLKYGFAFAQLEKDTMKSVRPLVEELLDSGLRIMFYNGHLDVAFGYTQARGMYQKLQFSGADEYSNAKRKQWHVGSSLAGYYKQGGTFTEVMVRNAGHMVTIDQPVWALDLISRFTRNQSLGSN